MLPALAERRVQLWRALSSKGPDALRVNRDHVRFALGTSLSDLKLPYEISPEAAGILHHAAVQLLHLLVSRHRAWLPPDEYDRFLLDEAFATAPKPGPALATTAGNPDVKSAAEQAPWLHPALTAGVLGAWLNPGGRGRSLVALVIELYRRAFAEMKAARGREETPYLASLLLAAALHSVDASLRSVALPSGVDRALRGAAATGIYLALRLGLSRGVRDLQPQAELLARLEAPLSPVALLGGRAHLPRSGSAFYGVDTAPGATLLDPAASALGRGEDPQAVAEQLADALEEDGALAQSAESAVFAAQLRERCLRAAVAGEQGQLPPSLGEQLRELASRPGQLPPLVADEAKRKALAKALLASVDQAVGPAQKLLEGLAEGLRGFKDKEPCAGLKLPRQEVRATFARCLLALACDLQLERACLPVLRTLEARTGREAEGGLQSEYEQGRLYRLSARPEPLLKEAKAAELAHLFVDVKDFTRRTALLGDAAMADFLRREFYLPILTAAKERFGGMAHLADKGGVSVNNLLGDALSLSGEIEALVQVAGDIRRLLLAYERRLIREVSSDVVTRAVRAIEDDYAARASREGADLARLAAERDAALARARGEGLEAGVFVAWGPAPVVVTIDDEVFGRSKVAIAEGINQSARGTARALGARARADALLQAERERRRSPGLSHAWSVFVGAPFSIAVPRPAEAAARAAMQRGELSTAMLALAEPVREALEDSAHAAPDVGDIYNAGVALSDAALAAFKERCGDSRIFRALEVPLDSVHPEIHARWYLGDGALKLLVAFHPNGALGEVFRFAGTALFKGLEHGVGVWELCGEGALHDALNRFHCAHWRSAR